MSAFRFRAVLLSSLLSAGCAMAAGVQSGQESHIEEKKQKQAVPRRAPPLLTDRPPSPAPPVPPTTVPAIPQTKPVAPGPSPVTGCDPGGCWSGGARYEGGTGGTYLDRSGRLCQGNGTWMQCF